MKEKKTMGNLRLFQVLTHPEIPTQNRLKVHKREIKSQNLPWNTTRGR
jgi:hypothetical protein